VIIKRDKYNKVLLQVIRDDENNNWLPVITEMDFWHICPVFTIPYGVLSQIDCDDKIFSIVESGVATI
jgi:muramoyltetrapeptide carboxypeptidase LdcA involved in peptidoglycan recycling